MRQRSSRPRSPLKIESLLGGFIGDVVTGCTLIVFAGIFGGLGRAAAYLAGRDVRD